MRRFRFAPALLRRPALTIGDVLIVLGIAAFLYIGIRLAFHAPAVVHGPEISLSPLALPWYALLSVGRMAAAYFLSILFSLFDGYAAARHRGARTVLMPQLDILQSAPFPSGCLAVLAGSFLLPQRSFVLGLA
jgi:NitT/TauT family transport system permease protein